MRSLLLSSSSLLLLLAMALWCGAAAAVSTHRHTHSREVGQPEHETHGAAGGGGGVGQRHHYDQESGGHNEQYDHQSVLGSRKEAKEFDHLPAEEAKARLAQLVTLMDTDDDGHVSRAELHQWLLKSFRKLAKEESADQFQDVDVNRDGRVTWQEHLTDAFDVASMDELDDASDDAKLAKQDRNLFAVADLDGDGQLTADEYLALTHPETEQRMRDTVIKNALIDKDTNGDGSIDISEFMRGLREDDDEHVADERERFKQFDKDADGRLDNDELFSWLQPSDHDIADDEVQHLFAASDDNLDDRLSEREIVDHHDVFVGSEATDFGEHLKNIDSLHDEL